MTEMAKGSVTHQRLIALLSQEGADFRVVTHEAVGKCEAVSEIRGTALGQGAKALVCKVKGNGVNQHVLAILAADQQADLSQLASHIGGLRASLASPAEVDELTGCVFGAIPPFSFHPKLKLVADPLLFERFDEIAFNAGMLDKSVILKTADYLRIAQPELVNFRRDATALNLDSLVSELEITGGDCSRRDCLLAGWARRDVNGQPAATGRRAAGRHCFRRSAVSRRTGWAAYCRGSGFADCGETVVNLAIYRPGVCPRPFLNIVIKAVVESYPSV